MHFDFIINTETNEYVMCPRLGKSFLVKGKIALVLFWWGVI